MTYAIIRIEGKKIRLATTTGYKTKAQAEQAKRIWNKIKKNKKVKLVVRKIS